MNMERDVPTANPELDRALAYLKNEIFEDEVIRGSVLGMEVGDSGWCAYWAVEADSAGRYWLRPLFKVDDEPFNSAAYIKRDVDGYKVNFSNRVLRGRDLLYEHVRPAEEIDEIQVDRPHWLPIAEVHGPLEKRPGYTHIPPPFPGQN